MKYQNLIEIVIDKDGDDKPIYRWLTWFPPGHQLYSETGIYVSPPYEGWQQVVEEYYDS